MFTGTNHGKGQIDLSHIEGHLITVKPVEIHLKEDGTITDEPSFCIVSETGDTNIFTMGEISLKMLNEGLEQIGYKISKL